MPVFNGCARRQLWRVARWGDVIEVPSGAVLAREDRSNHWFFVILAGSVKVAHRRRHVATLHRGGHFGEIAVIGFRPQPATATAVEPTMLFVLGRRHFLSLAATDRSIQRALFPDVAADAYRDFVRGLHEEGRLEWERLRPRSAPDRRMADIPDVPESLEAPRPPGRRLSWSDAVLALTRRDQERTPHGDGLREPVRTKLRPATVLVMTLVCLALLGVLSVLYHPPFAVMSSARPIDVVNDITITGAKIDRPTGRYLLTAVNVDRPNVVGVIASWVRGRKVVGVQAPGPNEPDASEEQRVVHEAFLNSHRQAIALAKKSSGVDPRGLTIVIRDRGIGGPSAGLTYALAIIDMLDPADLADGRVIAATGELRPNGVVEPVGLVAMKLEVARSGDADVFLVPASQSDEIRRAGLLVLGVKDLEGAVRALRR